MAIITAISAQEKDKNRCNVFVDGEFFVALPIDVVLDYRLKTGEEISEDKLREICLEGNKASALKKALVYVGAGLKTKKQVVAYLKRKEFTDNAVYYAVDKLIEYGFIDDAEYAKRYVEVASKKQGKRMSEFKLMEKGVRKEYIESAYEDVRPDLKETAKLLAEKKIKGKEINKENLAKVFRYLISKGFSYEEADFAISAIKGDG